MAHSLGEGEVIWIFVDGPKTISLNQALLIDEIERSAISPHA